MRSYKIDVVSMTKPTNTDQQQLKKMLEVLINPDYVGYSVTDICSVANVGRNKYYDAMANIKKAINL